MQHHNIYTFPSSTDKVHLKAVTDNRKEFEDQSAIPYPRLGFYGVIDEHFDIDLIKEEADAKPYWHFILIGLVIKIYLRSILFIHIFFGITRQCN